MAGTDLRQWMHIWLYAFIINVICSVFLAIPAFIESPAQLVLFGWFWNKDWFGMTLIISFFPGILGHTGFNYALKRISPLIISILLLFEPIFGTLLGYAIGVTGPPGMWTFIGTPIAIIGLIGVAVATEIAKKKKNEKQQVEMNTIEIISDKERLLDDNHEANLINSTKLEMEAQPDDEIEGQDYLKDESTYYLENQSNSLENLNDDNENANETDAVLLGKNHN